MSWTPPDHIGWTLWRAAHVWRTEFTAAMVAAGHEWFGQARAKLIPHIGPKGLRQSELVARSGLTKQAVQQFVDELERDGILTRVPDAVDARARRVIPTQVGLAAMQDADRIKAEIEARWREVVGTVAFAQLDSALQRLIAAGEGGGLPGQGGGGKKD
ncbi:MAG: MarR family transcriptional regulator [Tabrizicola sp.]|nr:MarR family transcriptional regulator [Tabrizicola sp.]